MTKVERTIELVRHPLVFRLLQVGRVTRLTPRMKRVTLGGDQLAGFISAAPDDHVKLFFPPAGESKPALPSMGPRGLEFPEGQPRPENRDYTPRRYDAAAGELDIDFVVHGDGPASTWASQATAGGSLGVAGPRGSFVVPDTFDWYLLTGDETAIPAIGRRLQELRPGVRVFAFVEVADATEEQEFKTATDLELVWLHRSDAKPGTTNLLESAIRAFTFPPGDAYTWAAGEASSMNAVRRHLLDDRGVNKDWMKVRGYWKRGVTDHQEPHSD